MNPYRIIDQKFEDLDNGVEPIDLTTAKKWLKVTFTDDDSVITSLITVCRQTIEDYCSISLRGKTINYIVDLAPANNRSCIEFELPYGPAIITDGDLSGIIVKRHDNNGSNSFQPIVLDTDYTIDGLEFYKFKTLIPGRYSFQYDAGYSVVPEKLKSAILNEIAHRYENRGDTSAGDSICEAAKAIAKPFKRMAWQ